MTERQARVAGHLAILAILGAISLLMFERVWVSGHPSSTVLCQCGDPGQAVWFMSWVPWAIADGHNPLFTTRMLAGQGGANLLQSTSYLLPSLLLAPVTWLFGATAGFNAAETLAPVLSGWAMYVAAGRLSQRWIPRAAAAVLWGCSPYLVSSLAYGHLNYSWLYFPPLLFFLLYDLIVDRRLRPVVNGALLAGLLVLQFFTGTEPLLLTLALTAVGLVVAVLAAPRAAWAIRQRLAVGFGTAALGAGIVLAYPLWYLKAGPQHVVGPPWPAINLVGTPLETVIRVGNVHLYQNFTRIGGYFGPKGPPDGFLGLAMLIVLGAGCMLFALRRQRVGLALVIAGGFGWLCGLGAFLVPLSDNSNQPWLPWHYLHSLPFFSSAGPQRFGMPIMACVCLALALALEDAAWGLGQIASPQLSSGTLRGGTGVALLAVAAFAGLPIATSYTFPLAMNPGVTPAWFLGPARALPANTRCLTYPYASSAAPDAMYWQAEDDLSFALVGGRALIPGADGKHSEHVSPFDGTQGLLTNDSVGVSNLAPPTVHQIRGLRSSLERWGVDVVVVVARGGDPTWATSWFTQAIGRPPLIQDGAAVWKLAGGRSATPMSVLSRSLVARCDRLPVRSGMMALLSRCLER